LNELESLLPPVNSLGTAALVIRCIPGPKKTAEGASSHGGIMPKGMSREQRNDEEGRKGMKIKMKVSCTLFAALAVLVLVAGPAGAAGKPNIILILSDDFGYGDSAPYGGGPGRGMPTPNLERLANEGMTFFSFYAQPSCTPGRAAVQTGRIPNRSGMTTVAFQGQGGGRKRTPSGALSHRGSGS
jgi:hypothetical protein